MGVVGTTPTATINETKERLMVQETGAGDKQKSTNHGMNFLDCLITAVERTRPGVIL